jgi:hypothetical protein
MEIWTINLVQTEGYFSEVHILTVPSTTLESIYIISGTSIETSDSASWDTSDICLSIPSKLTLSFISVLPDHF